MTLVRTKKDLATFRLVWIVSIFILAVIGFAASIHGCSPVPNLSSPTATVVGVTATAYASSTATAAVRVDSSPPASNLTPSASQSLPSPSPTATDTPFHLATMTPTTTSTPSPSSTPFPLPTPTVDPTPIAFTATPSPQPPVTFVWNEAEATRLAAERVALEGLPISNVNVTLQSGTLRLTGNVALVFSSSPVTVEATPRVEDGRLVFTVTTIAMSGLDVSSWRAAVEAAITNTFAGILSGYDVQSYTLQDGELRVQAIRR